MHKIFKSALPLAAVATLALGGVAMAKTVMLTGSFMPENGTTTSPTGTVKATLNTRTGSLSYTISYAGLSGPVQAAHFHGPAPMGKDAGVLVPIPGPYQSGMSGHAKVSSAVVKDLEHGMTYVNLHTAAEPMGEARAQLTMAK
jgi:hypothetical protein